MGLIFIQKMTSIVKIAKIARFAYFFFISNISNFLISSNMYKTFWNMDYELHLFKYYFRKFVTPLCVATAVVSLLFNVLAP